MCPVSHGAVVRVGAEWLVVRARQVTSVAVVLCMRVSTGSRGGAEDAERELKMF
jgi:hypothetical protein